MTEQVKLVAESGPLGAQLVANFEAQYVAVQFDPHPGTLDRCDRCGATVPDSTQLTHSEWHEDLSFRLFMLMSFVKDHVKLHEQVSAELTSLLEES